MTVEWKEKRKKGRKGRFTMGDDGLLQFAYIFLCFAFRRPTDLLDSRDQRKGRGEIRDRFLPDEEAS